MKSPLLTLTFVGIAALATLAPASGQVVLVDFGPVAPGNPVAGQTWNQWEPGNNINLLEADTGLDTGWNLFSTTGAGQNSGFVPAVTPEIAPFNHLTIAGDALLLTSGDGTRNVVFSGLNTSLAYNFEIYAGRDSTETRVTTFTLTGSNSDSGTLTTSGTGIGTGPVNYNNTTILSINGISPTIGGQITLSYQATTGGFGYLNGLTVTAVPEPTTWALLAGSLTTLVVFRRRRS